jgi:hypothetical protein
LTDGDVNTHLLDITMKKGHHEGEHRAVDGDWVARLPSLEGLFASQRKSVLSGIEVLADEI